jgi:hypothetical protein
VQYGWSGGWGGSGAVTWPVGRGAAGAKIMPAPFSVPIPAVSYALSPTLACPRHFPYSVPACACACLLLQLLPSCFDPQHTPQVDAPQHRQRLQGLRRGLSARLRQLVDTGPGNGVGRSEWLWWRDHPPRWSRAQPGGSGLKSARIGAHRRRTHCR